MQNARGTISAARIPLHAHPLHSMASTVPSQAAPTSNRLLERWLDSCGGALTWQHNAAKVRLPAAPPHSLRQGGIRKGSAAKGKAPQKGGRRGRRRRGSIAAQQVQQAKRAQLGHSAAQGVAYATVAEQSKAERNTG